jgi:Rho-binding antiterminator
MHTPYTPIDCAFHDEILSLATHRRVCQIIFMDDTGKEVSVSDQINDVYSRGSEEFLRLRGGPVIRLDRIVSVNGKFLHPSCEP